METNHRLLINKVCKIVGAKNLTKTSARNWTKTSLNH